MPVDESDRSDAELIREAACDVAAFGVLYERHALQVFTWCRRRLRSRQPDVRHQHGERNAARHLQGTLRFVHRFGARRRIRARDVERWSPAAAGKAFTNRCMHAVQRQASVRQPFLQVRDRRGVPIVKVRPRREHLDPIEAVRGDLEQVLPA